MLFNLVLLVSVPVLSCIYLVFYYLKYNKVLGNRSIKIYKTTPGKFATYVSVFALILSLGNSVIIVNALEKRIVELKEYTNINRYLKEDFSSERIRYVFENYNLYFGGTYIDDGKTLICLRNDAPDELLEYMDLNDLSYVFVRNNYSDLVQLNQLIVSSMSNVEGYYFIGIDEKENKIIIYTTQTDDVENMFQTYINEEILEVRYGGEITYK